MEGGGLSDTILKGTHLGTIPARFGLIWFSGFRGEDLNVIFYQNMPNLVSSINKTYQHDKAEILLKVTLNTINQTKPIYRFLFVSSRVKNIIAIKNEYSIYPEMLQYWKIPMQMSLSIHMLFIVNRCECKVINNLFLIIMKLHIFWQSL